MTRGIRLLPGRGGGALVRPKSLAGPLVKSIIFILATSLATAVLGISIANTGVGATTSYTAVFTDVTGLAPGDDVDIAGARVGEVTSISLIDHNLAQVGISVQSGHPLPASVIARILYLNLVGQRYIELDRGAGPVGQTLPAGGTIPLDRTTPALDLTELFNGFQPLFEALSPATVNQLSSELVQVFQGQGTSITSLIANVGTLTTTLAAKDRVIGQVIDNLNALLRTVDSRSSELSGTVTTLQQLVSGLAADRQPIGAAISAISGLTNATAGLLQAYRPPLKADIDALHRLSAVLAAGSPVISSFLRNLPAKMTDIARLASYGSWLNFYLCDAAVSGVQEQVYPGQDITPPSGVSSSAARCK